MRKNGKGPTRKQKEKLKSSDLDTRGWLIVKDYPKCFEIVHRVSGERRKLGA